MNRKLIWFDVWDNDNLEEDYCGGDNNIHYTNKPTQRDPRGNCVTIFNKSKSIEEDYIFYIGYNFSFYLYRMDSDTFEKKELVTDGRILFEVTKSLIEALSNTFEICLEENISYITYDKLEKIFEESNSKDLLEHLLDKNKGRRRIAEERLRELEKS